MKIPVSKPDITDLERQYVSEAMTSGWISSKGPFVERFEEKWATWNGYKYGVATSSGYTALVVALRALGVGVGDEVIVPEFTMIATARAVEITGAKPVFVDCYDNLNIDPDKIEGRINERTKVILPVHIYGRSCDMKSILELARKYGLKVVEDSAEAHGVKPKGDIACFSLFANKIISSGEGGICITRNRSLAEEMQKLRSFYFDEKHTFLHPKAGDNFRMTNLQAAIALAQCERIEEILEKRQRIEWIYDQGLRDTYGVHRLPRRDVLWMFDVVADDRDGLMLHLERHGIETRCFFKPMSQQPMYRNPSYLNLQAYEYSVSGLYLPTFTNITEDEQGYVIKRVREFYEV